VNRAALALVFALGGCALVKEPPPAVVDAEPGDAAPVVPDTTAAPAEVPEPPPRVERASPEPAELRALLAEFSRLRKLPGAELARAQEAARLAFNQSRSDVSRVRLAMALTVPGSPVNDEARALELLDPVARNAASPLQDLAFLLGSYVFEQRRLGAQVQTLQQNVQGLQGNVQALQGNVQALQQKLDALKTLERSLSERREGGMTPRR
jgi:hypothetical protein